MHKMIEIENILVERDDNYRKDIDEDAVRGLYKSFKSVAKRTNGARWMLNPVDVVKLPEPIDDKEYRLRFGFRRMLAAQYGLEKHPSANAFMSKVPAFVVDKPEDEEAGADMLMALVENLQREDVHVLDEAFAVQKALDATGNTMVQMGKEVGKSKGWVSQRLALLDLPDEVQAALRENEITFGHARALGRINDEEAQIKLLDLVDMNDWSVKELNKHVKSLRKGDPTPQTWFIADGTDVDSDLKNDDKSDDEGGSKSSKDEDSDEGGSKPGTQTVETIRPVKTLTEKVKDLSDRVASAEKMAKAADPRSRPQQEKRSAFYAGAQRGIAWALGQLDDVEYEDLFGDDDDGDGTEEAAE